MRRNHQPYWLHRLLASFNQFYIRTRVVPQFDAIGDGLNISRPRQLRLFGDHILAGKHLHVICERNKPVELTNWKSKQNHGQILLGDYVLLSPGVQISSATKIRIGNNCMIGAETQISDCDWHGTYNRVRPFRCSKEINIEDNVWIGQRAMIGKGVHIGENSIIAAGAVVNSDVAKNTIVGGNPAKHIKSIDPAKRMLTREFLFSREQEYSDLEKQLAEYTSANNTTAGWLRSIVFPNQND